MELAAYVRITSTRTTYYLHYLAAAPRRVVAASMFFLLCSPAWSDELSHAPILPASFRAFQAGIDFHTLKALDQATEP